MTKKKVFVFLLLCFDLLLFCICGQASNTSTIPLPRDLSMDLPAPEGEELIKMLFFFFASNAQGITDELIEWSHKNRVVLNPDKCKELRILFSPNPEAFDPVSIDGNEIEVVNSAKLLGITLSDNLTWNSHVDEVVKKASKKLYFLVQLKWGELPRSDLVLFYLPCVRSTVDYGVPAFYNTLLQYLKNELVHIEKGHYR